MNKLFYALSDRLDKLLEEHAELYFRERPWIDTPKVKHILTPEEVMKHSFAGNFWWVDAPRDFIDLSEERKQIELEIQKVSKRLQWLTAPPMPSEPAEDATIIELFGPFAS